MPSAYSINYSEQVFAIQKDNMWSLGKNMSVGDSFTFRICDPNAIPNYSAESYHYFTQDRKHNSSLCYVAKMDFVNLLDSHTEEIDRDVWIVKTTIRDRLADSIRHSVFHIDSKSYEVRSGNTIHPDDVRYAQSLHNTIFSIFKYSDEPKLLKLGSEWGPVTESLESGSYPYMTVLDENIEYSATLNRIDYGSNMVEIIEREFPNVYQVGYSIDMTNSDNDDVTTSYLVSPDIPFPLSGIKYSPVHITKPFKVFEFELLSYVLQNRQDMIQDNVTLSENNMDETISPDDDYADVGLTKNKDSSNEIISANIDDTTDDSINDDDKTDAVEDNYQIDNKDSTLDVTDKQDKHITITVDENMENVSENDDNTGAIQYRNDENIISENNDVIIHQNKTHDKAQDSTTAYVLLVVVPIVFTALFVYFKRFRIHSNKNSIKPKEKKTFHGKTICFEDNLTIDIKTKEDDPERKAPALNANDYSVGEDCR